MTKMDILAECVSRGTSIEEAARSAGVTVEKAYSMWRKICKQLGPQAR